MRPAFPLLLLLAGCEQDYTVHAQPIDVDPGQVTDCGFTQVDSSDYYRYDCNPVFSSTGEDWAPTVRTTAFAVTKVLDHPFYQIWYTGTPDSDGLGTYGLGYAVSDNGTDWSPHPDNPLLTQPEGKKAFDASSMDAMHVVWDPTSSQYVLIYQGFNADEGTQSLGVATSTDGSSWSRLPTNPVVDFLKPSGSVTSYCWPLGLTLGEITGFTGYVAGQRKGKDACEVFRLNAANVADWSTDDELIFGAGDNGSWDDKGFISLAFAELDGVRHMFYVGFGDWKQQGTYQVTQHQFLGHALFQGGQWVRDQEPIPLNMTEAGEISAVAAVTVASRIHIWITDSYPQEDGSSIGAVGYFLYDPNRAEKK